MFREIRGCPRWPTLWVYTAVPRGIVRSVRRFDTGVPLAGDRSALVRTLLSASAGVVWAPAAPTSRGLCQLALCHGTIGRLGLVGLAVALFRDRQLTQ